MHNFNYPETTFNNNNFNSYVHFSLNRVSIIFVSPSFNFTNMVSVSMYSFCVLFFTWCFCSRTLLCLYTIVIYAEKAVKFRKKHSLILPLKVLLKEYLTASAGLTMEARRDFFTHNLVIG